MANNIQHFGIKGMKWGQRKRAEDNARAAATKNGVMKPTYQYRDSKGNLVSRYGPGKYGGPKGDNTKPKSDPKGDDAFVKSVEAKLSGRGKNSPEQVKQKSENLIQLAKKKISDLPDNQKKALVFTAAFAGTLATTVALAKGSDVLVSALQQRSYDRAIRDIATVIIDAKLKN